MDKSFHTTKLLILCIVAGFRLTWGTVEDVEMDAILYLYIYIYIDFPACFKSVPNIIPKYSHCAAVQGKKQAGVCSTRRDNNSARNKLILIVFYVPAPAPAPAGERRWRQYGGDGGGTFSITFLSTFFLWKLNVWF